MARSVADAAIMFDAIAGRDPKDPTSLIAYVYEQATAWHMRHPNVNPA